MKEFMISSPPSSSGGAGAVWEDSGLAASQTAYMIIDAGGDYDRLDATTEFPLIIGGWRSDTQATVPTVQRLNLSMRAFQTRLTDAARIGARPMVCNPPWRDPLPGGTSFVQTPEWTTQDVLSGIRIAFVSGTSSIGSGGTTPSNTADGVTVCYLGPQRPQPTMFSFTLGGTVNPTNVARFNKSTGSVVIALTGFPNHQLCPRAVVGPDKETAYIIGGASATANAHGLLNSFNMKNAAAAASGGIAYGPKVNMPFPASRGIAYLDNDGDTIVYIGGNQLPATLANAKVTDNVSDLIQRYSISKGTWSVDEQRFPVKIVGATYVETSSKRYICFGYGNTENKVFIANKA